jgi:pyruvate kinase
LLRTGTFGQAELNVASVPPLAIENAKQHLLAKRGEQMIITAGYPFGNQGNTNILYIVDV